MGKWQCLSFEMKECMKSLRTIHVELFIKIKYHNNFKSSDDLQYKLRGIKKDFSELGVPDDDYYLCKLDYLLVMVN